MKYAIFYTILAVVLAFAGYFKDPLYYIGAIIVGGCAFYWIIKEWRKNGSSKKKK